MGNRGAGVGVALTAEELVLGGHGALHDLWLDEASTESVCIRGVVLQGAGQPIRTGPCAPPAAPLHHPDLTTRGQQRPVPPSQELLWVGRTPHF